MYRVLEEHFKADSAYRVAVNEPIPAAQDGSTFINDPNTPSKDKLAYLIFSLNNGVSIFQSSR